MKKIIVSSSATLSLLFLSPNLVDAEENVINQEVINETERKLNNVLTNEAAVENKDTAQNTAKGTSNINDKVEENESALEERSPTGSKEAIADLEEPTSTESEEAIADLEEPTPDESEEAFVELEEPTPDESEEAFVELEEPTPDESEEAVADLEEPTPTESEEIVADSGELTSTESEEAVEESKQVETEEIVVVTEEAAAHDQSLDEKLDEAKDDEKHVIQEENGNDSLKENQKISRLSLFAVLDTKSMNLTDEKAEELVENLNRLGFSDGSKLDKKIKELQEYYGLDVTGKVNKETLQKIDEILNHPLQKGNYVDEVIPYKDMLNRIGYDGIAVTNNFGSFTEKRVKQFQRDYQLPISGIIEEITGSKIKSVFDSIFQEGSKHESVRELKQNLNRLGFNGLADANTYGSFTTKRVKEFQEYYGLEVTGKADLETLNKIDEILDHPLQKGNYVDEVIPYKDMLNRIGYNGIAVTNNFGSFTEKRVKQFQKDHQLPVSGIIEEITGSKIKSVFDSIFQEGSKHESVRELKQNLNRLGFDGLANANTYGSFTTKRVKQFQEYYGLEATGKADLKTLNKIDEILNHPLQKGNYVDEVIPYKDMLNRIGYDGIAVTNNFGSFTEKRVKQFQRDYKLPASGIIEDITASKIKSVFESIFQQGSKHESVRKLKQNLNRLGFDGLADANTYGSFTTKRVKQFQAYYGLKVTGKADLATLNKIDEILNHPLQKGKHHPETIRLKKALNALGYNGLAITTNFGSFTEKRVKQFQADHDLPVSGIAEKNTLDTLYELLDFRTFTQYNITLHDALAIQMKVNPQTDKHYAYVSKKYVKNGQVTASALNVRSGPGTKKSKIGMLYNGDKVKILGEHNGWYRIEFRSSAWKDAAPEDVKYYLDPSNFINDDRLVFQFLDLSKPSNTSASVLNRYLEGKGILDGMGQAFIDASKKHGVNDLYLLSHALLETGNGSSTLANGVKVNGKTVYNMFGIGANDGCAIQCGAQRAYKEGWFTPYDAIVGGARFIGNSYIKKGQNTLYKMRWNPEGMEKYGYATHQYATDIGWAAKQVTSMYNMYKNIGITNLILDIPRYL